MTSSNVAARDIAAGRPSHSYIIVHIREKRDDPKDALLDVEACDDLAYGGGLQSSGKTGKGSSARKMSSARYNYGPVPSSQATPGAHGREIRG